MDSNNNQLPKSKRSHQYAAILKYVIVIGVFIIGVALVVSTDHHRKIIASDVNSQGSVSNTNSTISSSNDSASQIAAPAENSPSCFTASQSWNEIGQTGCVTFTGYAYTSDSGQMYLDQNSSNYTDGFSIWIPAGEAFGASVLDQYSGTPINVTGTIIQYHGAPEIEVTTSSQIQAAN